MPHPEELRPQVGTGQNSDRDHTARLLVEPDTCGANPQSRRGDAIVDGTVHTSLEPLMNRVCRAVPNPTSCRA